MPLEQFRNYKLQTEKILQDVFIEDFFADNDLSKAIHLALFSNGKRLRPILVFSIAKALNKSLDVSFSACAIELLHVASLITDDLPCMDNKIERRGVSTLHIVFNESTAILSSYALISSAYNMIRKNIILLSKHISSKKALLIMDIVLQNISFNTGAKGILLGQFSDLLFIKHKQKISTDIINKKTYTIFEVCFVLGWLFGGGSIKHLEKIKEAAFHFGLAFQIADDLTDIKEDNSQFEQFNYASFYSVNKAISKIEQELNLYKKIIVQLFDNPHELLSLATIIESSLGAYSFSNTNP